MRQRSTRTTRATSQLCGPAHRMIARFLKTLACAGIASASGALDAQLAPRGGARKGAAAPVPRSARLVLALERRADLPCTMASPGWSNIFFEGDSVSPEGRVAPFTTAPLAPRIDVVERRGDDGVRRYLARATGGTERALDFEIAEKGLRCATVELPVGHAGAPVRLQVAISADQRYAYGRVAEYREGRLAAGGSERRVEVWPAGRNAVRLDALGAVEIFVAGASGSPITRAARLDTDGTARPSDLVSGAFALDGVRFVVDSVRGGGTHLVLLRVGDVTMAARGFRAPAFVGRRLDGTRFELPARPGRLTVIEFWATDCPFSARARPEVVRLATALEAGGGAFVTMARDIAAADVRAHLTTNPRGGTALLQDSTTWEQWNPRAVTPLFYVLDADGRILLRESGASVVPLVAKAAGLPPSSVTAPAAP